MALTNASRLADFGTGIGTQGAILQVDNADQRVGIGTTDPDTKLEVKGTIKGIDVSVSGASTITGNLEVGGNIDLTGNITIGGTVTYEDVTNVDSLGIITARSGINMSGGQFLVGTGVTIGVAGVATFRSGIDCNGDIDVDGHTNLDNTDIVGILTVTSTTQYGGFKLSNNSNIVAELVGLSGSNDTGALALWSGGSKYVQLSAIGDSFLTGGSLGIGTNNPSGKLDISAAASTDMLMFKNGATNFARLGFNSASGTAILDVRSEGHTRFLTNGNNERLRITTTGTVLKGLTTARQNYSNNTSGVEYGFQIEATSATKSSLSLIRSSNDANDGGIFIGKTRSTSVGGNTVVQAGDDLGTITFGGADGTSLLFGAEILAEVQSGVGNDDMPTDLIFKTNGGSTTTVERFRIYSGGQVGIRNTNATSFNGGGDDLVIGNATDGKDAGITLYSHSSDNGSIFFNDTADTGLTGLIQYRHSEDAMRFVVATQERLRIDSAGVARFINPTGQLTLASSTNNDSGKILFQENTTGAWSLEAQRANGYFRISDEYNGNSGSAAERLRIEPADNGNTTITDNNLVIKKTSIAGNGVGGITIGKDVSGVDGCVQINSVNTGADTDQLGIDFRTHRSTAGSAAPQETLRITHRGRLLYREYPYTDTYQGNNWGGAYYLKGGWMRFTSNFSNPTKDLVILPDGGNTNSGMFIKVTVMQLDYPGGDRGVGAIHIGYASAKRKGDASGKWHVECSSSMNMEPGSNFHGNFSSMGSLSWENSNPSDTNTLRYTANRVTNYDTYDVQVEVWEAGNCAYYLHSDFLTQ